MKQYTQLLTDTDKESKIGTIYVYGVIGQSKYRDWETGETEQEGIRQEDVIKAIASFKKEGVTRLNVRINSPGGIIMEGDGIVASLKSSGMEVHTYCDGVCASYAASLFFAAKKENRHIARNGKLMLHDARVLVYGSSKLLRTAADNLDVFSAASIAQLSEDTELSEDRVRELWFDGEDHWLSAKQVLDYNLVTQIGDYEAEKTPDTENMSEEQLFSFFQKTEKKENSLFEKFKNWINQNSNNTETTFFNNNNEEEMTIDSIVAACESGELNKIALLDRLNAKQKKEETEQTLTTANVEALIEAAIQKAVQPLQETIEAQKAEIEKLGNEPGATATSVAASHDTFTDEVELTDREKELIAYNQKVADAAKENNRLIFS